MRTLLLGSVVGLLAVAVSGCGCSSQREILQMEQDRIALECKLEKLRAEREKYKRDSENRRREAECAERETKEWQETLKKNAMQREERMKKLFVDAPKMVAEAKERENAQIRNLKDDVKECQAMNERVREFAIKHRPLLWREIDELRAQLALLVVKVEEMERESKRLGVTSDACKGIRKRRDEVMIELRKKEMLVEKMYIEEQANAF